MKALARDAVPRAGAEELDNRRALAAVVDLLIVLAGALVIGLAAGLSGSELRDPGLAMGAVITAWALYYYFAFESGAGQTPGKKLTRIRVVRLDGGPAGMSAIALRTALRLIDGLFLYLVGAVVMLATGARRGRLGDLAAGTMIVPAEARPPREAAEARPAPAIPAVPLPQPARGPAPTPKVPEMRPFEPVVEPAEAAPAPSAADGAPPESLKELARDVAAEPPEEPAPEVAVRPVETVSAIDLVMDGADAPADSSPPSES